MIYKKFQDLDLSRLGFGTMRLPVKEDKSIDEAQVAEMVDYAIKHGINYFDTAMPYHAGTSETVVGRVLSKYPRESYYLATKYPGHQIASTYDPAATFEEQLRKCGVDYFDFYLLHNVNENSIGVYMDPQWGILDYFVEQRRLGRIKHLGFSSHGRPDNLRKFLEYCGDQMEFCQIQLNYLDWTLQDAKQKCAILDEYHLPVWVMEPVRGGKLAQLPAEDEQKLRALRPDESIPAWAFRWLQGQPQVQVVLSGMSNLAQMQDNVRTYEQEQPLTAAEDALLMDIAERLKNAVPCTACRYCCDGCPQGLDIPVLIHAYNDLKFSSSITISIQMEAMPEDKLPSACIACGQCMHSCPQQINVPKVLSDFAEALKSVPKWSEICRQREEEARRAKQQG